MLARMTYFRVKWATLPDGYAEFLTERRHVFQVGGRGGVSPGDYLNRPHTPQPDDDAPRPSGDPVPASSTPSGRQR